MSCALCRGCGSAFFFNILSKQQRSICVTGYLCEGQKNSDEKQVTKIKPTPKEIFMREFPDCFRDGKFVARMGYVQFIDEALARMKELGLERNREAYKELFRVFPPGEYLPPDKNFVTKWQSFPQQMAATRILHQMALNRVPIDKDFERLTVSVFSIYSEVWNKVARTNYWNMKMRNVDKYPLAEELPKEPHKLAKLGLERMLDDELSIICTKNTSSLPDSVDKTWVVFSQSPTQRSIIDNLDDKSILYIEEGGLTWVGRESLSYYVLKYYVDEEVAKKKRLPKKLDYNFNTLEMRFYGKPIRDKMVEKEEMHYVDGAYILSIGMTGTSSQESLSSWLKFLQQRNPKLKRLNVVFRLRRRVPEIIEYGSTFDDDDDDDDDRHRERHQGANQSN